MSYSDWVAFAGRYPTVVDSLYYRPRGVVADTSYYSTALADAEAQASVRRARETQIRSYYTSYNAEKTRLDAEYRTRQAAADAALYYRPYSPRYGYLSSY